MLMCERFEQKVWFQDPSGRNTLSHGKFLDQNNMHFFHKYLLGFTEIHIDALVSKRDISMGARCSGDIGRALPPKWPLQGKRWLRMGTVETRPGLRPRKRKGGWSWRQGRWVCGWPISHSDKLKQSNFAKFLSQRVVDLLFHFFFLRYCCEDKWFIFEKHLGESQADRKFYIRVGRYCYCPNWPFPRWSWRGCIMDREFVVPQNSYGEILISSGVIFGGGLWKVN